MRVDIVPALETWRSPNTTKAPCLIYNGGLGAQPPAGSRCRAPGEGGQEGEAP